MFEARRMPEDVAAEAGGERAMLRGQERGDVECNPQQDCGGDGNPPIGKAGQHPAPYPIGARDRERYGGKQQGGRDRGAPQAGRVAGQAKKRREMLEIPVEVEVAPEQARGRRIGEVEQGRPDHEQGQQEGKAAFGNETRARQSRHCDQKEDARELSGGTPLCGETVRHRVARRKKNSGEQHYPEDSCQYHPGPCSRSGKLRWGWCHRVPRAMSSGV